MVQLLLEQRAASRAMFSNVFWAFRIFLPRSLIATIVRACLGTWKGSSTQAWVDFLFLRPQSFKHCYSDCGIERQQIIDGNLLFLTFTLSWFPCISFFMYIFHFLNVHTHTQTHRLYVCIMISVLFWILRKHGPCLLRSFPIRCFLACHGAAW